MPVDTRGRRERLIKLAFIFFHQLDDEYKLLGIMFLAYAFNRPKRSIRGPYNARRSQDVLNTILYAESEKHFKAHVRMSRPNFAHILSLIKDHPVFVSTGYKPQRPVSEQLAAFLMRVSGKITLHASTDTAIAEGTVHLYCSRVCRAILSLRDEYLSWPDQARRKALKSELQESGFPGCIGILDATLIPLSERPRKDGWAYYCRKKFYALVVQAVCDNRGKFTHYDMGWPGSVQDTKVFRSSSIFIERSKHFNWDEYILCDKAIEDSERLRWREDIHSTIQILAGSEQTQKTAPHSVISATEISTITITGEGVRSFAEGDTVPFYESSSPEMLKRKRDAEPSLTEQCQEPQKRNRTEPECPTEQQGVPDPEPTPLKSIPKKYEALVTVLRELRMENVHEIKRCQLSEKLLQQDEHVFDYLNNRSEKISKIIRYANGASSARIVKLSGKGDSEVTVKLRSEYW